MLNHSFTLSIISLNYVSLHISVIITLNTHFKQTQIHYLKINRLIFKIILIKTRTDNLSLGRISTSGGSKNLNKFSISHIDNATRSKLNVHCFLMISFRYISAINVIPIKTEYVSNIFHLKYYLQTLLL